MHMYGNYEGSRKWSSRRAPKNFCSFIQTSVELDFLHWGRCVYRFMLCLLMACICDVWFQRVCRISFLLSLRVFVYYFCWIISLHSKVIFWATRDPNTEFRIFNCEFFSSLWITMLKDQILMHVAYWSLLWNRVIL